MPDTRERQPRLPAEVRREQVLDAALDLVVEDGYAAATMEAIARRVGVAKTVVYAAYRRRAPLLEALIARETERVLEPLLTPITHAELQATALDPADPAAGVLAWINRMLVTIAEHPRRWKLVLLPPAGSPASVRQAIREGRQATRARVAELLAPVRDAHTHVSDLDLELMAHAVVAICEQLAAEMLEQPEHFTPERLRSFAGDFVRLVLP